MRLSIISILTIALIGLTSIQTVGAFGNQPPLGPKDYTRQLFAPYDLIKLNCLGTNYCENLFDMRSNILSYTHQDFDSNTGDAWHLQYPDDMGRFMEAIAWEAEFSPVVRLELQRRMVKGLMKAHIPGTKSYYFFRHRNWGKTLLIFDDYQSDKTGRVTLTNMQDFIEGFLKVGFSAVVDGKQLNITDFDFKDDVPGAGNPGPVRSPENWNVSPYIFNRTHTNGGINVRFTGRYWLSGEDKPVEYTYSSTDIDKLQVVVGEPDEPMAILREASVPGVIHLPDRKTTFSSDETGDKIFKNPKFNYLILRKPTAWGTWGYSTAVLIMWEGKPESIEAIAENGYGQIKITYPKKDGKCVGRIWLFPFTWLNTNDMTYVYRNAENFLKNGRLLHNGYPSLDFVNAAPAGLAAAAYMLTKYNDPMASIARIRAANAVDALFDGEKNNMKMIRVYFPVKAAAWMIKTGKLIRDREMVSKYTKHLDIVMKRMLSQQQGYDGKALPSGWEHFHLVKASWLAYDATGNEEYKAVWERSLSVYTIDKDGIYRYGEKMEAPGGFDTYFGAMPLGVWGHAGMMDNVDTLLNLNVPAGWHVGERPVKDLFHDTGCGPWSQDDANPDFCGFCLRGLNIPQERKRLIPVGAFPIYDSKGNVQITNAPMTINPFFLPSKEKETIIDAGTRITHNVTSIDIVPGSAGEQQYLIGDSGNVENRQRICKGKESIVYKFDTSDAIGAGLEARIKGEGFKFEVSPDGKRWYQRLDTWDDKIGSQALDLSFLTGCREELLEIMSINSENDSKYLVENKKSSVQRGYSRYVEKDGELIYKLPLPDAAECHLEIMAGNSYKIQYSSDGKSWHDGVDSSQTNGGTDAAWITMLDVSDCMKDKHTVYLRFTDGGSSSLFNGRGAFLQKISVYGTLNSGKVYVKISNTDKRNTFILNGLTFKTWTD